MPETSKIKSAEADKLNKAIYNPLMTTTEVQKNPSAILKVDINTLNANDLKKHLITIVIAEYKCTGPKVVPKLKRYRFQLRDARKKTATLYQEKGGVLSNLLFKHCLPSYLQWPGVIGLIQHKGFENYLVNFE